MPMIPDLKQKDITITEKLTQGYDNKRCKKALWSIHNIIKKITADFSAVNGLPLHYSNSDKNTDYTKIIECLYVIGVNAIFKDKKQTSLVYTGKTNKKYRRNMPAVKYLFQLEKYGFVFYDLVTVKKDVPRNKLTTKDISQFVLSYNAGDFDDVIFGLKLFSDICMTQSGDCFYAADIRVAFKDAPKLYAPPADEIFFILPEEQQKAAYMIHNKLEELGCIRNLEREYMTRYIHPKNKSQTFATIYTADFKAVRMFIVKLNLRNIGKYEDYLSKCTESIRQSLFNTEDCYMGKSCVKKCGGVSFEYNGAKYHKCLWHIFRFNDFSKKAVENYTRLIELEDRECRK